MNFKHTLPNDGEIVEAFSNAIARLMAEHQRDLSDEASGALANLRLKLSERIDDLIRVPEPARPGTMGTICGECAPDDGAAADLYYRLLVQAFNSCGRFTPGEFLHFQEAYGQRAGFI